LRRFLRDLWTQMLREHTQPGRLAWAVGLGLFVGTLPLFGLHLGICIVVAVVLRLNKLTMYLAANISNPLMAPILVATSIALGEWLRFGAWRPLNVAQGRAFVEQLALLSWRIPDLFLSCLLGGAVLGAALGLVGGVATFVWATRRNARRAAEDPEDLQAG